MNFEVGQKVKFVIDRRPYWQEDRELTVSKVRNHGRVVRGVSHHQSLRFEETGEDWFSGWYFDPEAVTTEYEEVIVDYRRETALSLAMPVTSIAFLGRIRRNDQ